MTQPSTNIEGQGKYVQANGLRIYYEEHGSGIPLILLHGAFGTGWSDWQAIIPALAPHFHVFAPDRRGHGRTDSTSDPMSYRTMADDMAAFIKVLGLEKPLVCGFSDGGQVSLELALRYPGLARALVIGAATDKRRDQFFKTLPQFGFEIDRSGAVNLPYFTEKNPEMLAWLKSAHHAEDPDFWQTHLQQHGAMWRAPLNTRKEDLQKIADPTLILAGDRDEFVPLQGTINLYRRIPGAELAIIPNTGHQQLLRSDGPFIPTILDFFQRHS